MWKLSRDFVRGLRDEAKRIHVTRRLKVAEFRRFRRRLALHQRDREGFNYLTPLTRGRLVAQLLGQAERDGASRMEFHYPNNRMWVVVGTERYEVVPPPAPELIDICRSLVRASRARRRRPGHLSLSFADATVRLAVAHLGSFYAPALEVSGFTARPTPGWLSSINKKRKNHKAAERKPKRQRPNGQ